MAELNKRQYKDLDKRIADIKEWMDEEKSSLSNRNLINNFSYLVSTMERLQGGVETGRAQMNQMQEGLAENYRVVNEFLEKTDKVKEWDEFLEEKRAEAEEKHRKDNDPNYKEEQKLKELEQEAEDDTDTE